MDQHCHPDGGGRTGKLTIRAGSSSDRGPHAFQPDTSCSAS
jgi:hypothetical protein